MKYRVIFCFLMVLGKLSATEAMATAQGPNKDKLTELIEQYAACIQRCEAEKDRVTPGYYKYMRNQCHAPFLQLVLDLEKAAKAASNKK
jgi:hypothetical protein